MEKYTKAQMDVIEFENEDVITTSCSGDCNWDCTCVAPGTGYAGKPGTSA